MIEKQTIDIPKVGNEQGESVVNVIKRLIAIINTRIPLSKGLFINKFITPLKMTKTTEENLSHF